MALLYSEDFPSIRRVISRSFDEDTLPDQDIQDPLVLPVAEEWVSKRTEALTLEGDNVRHARMAAIYYAAYLLAPSLQSQLAAAHSIHAGGVSGGVPNAKQIADECLRRAEREIDWITGSPEVPEPEREESPVSYAIPVETW